MNANMKVSAQCRIAASKGNHAVLGMIGRNKNNEYITRVFDMLVDASCVYVYYYTGRIRLVTFRPTILGSAHPRIDKMLLTEAGQSNGKLNSVHVRTGNII